MGWRLEDSVQRRIKSLNAARSFEPFREEPFIRMSICSDVEAFERTLRAIPNDYTVAIEYNAEAGFSVGRYLEYVKSLHKRNPNIGFSIDLAHILEYYHITEGGRDISSSVQATMNVFINFLNDKSNVGLVRSIDVNNASKDMDGYSQTHKLFDSDPALDIQSVMDQYKEYLKRARTLDGRICLEFFPKDISLFLDSDSNVRILAAIQSFNMP